MSRGRSPESAARKDTIPSIPGVSWDELSDVGKVDMADSVAEENKLSER